MITYNVPPTEAEAALQARVMSLSLGQLKDICRELFNSPRENDEEVFDACLGRIGTMVGDREFIAFCQELED